jgi:hypothetical protein
MPFTSRSRAGAAAITSATPKFCDQLLCQRLHVALRNRTEEHEIEQFVMAHRVGARLAKPRRLG